MARPGLVPNAVDVDPEPVKPDETVSWRI